MADSTRREVIRQLDAMAVEDLEVGVLTPERKNEPARMILRQWNRENLLKSLRWLMVKNLSGSHIFIRPYGSQGLIFVDDLAASSLAGMKQAGIQPAVIVESSPANYQAWVRVSNEPIEKALASATGRLLARRFGGDPGSTDWRHFGRLAGFANRKPKYAGKDGRYPYVTLSETRPDAGKLTMSPAIRSLLGDARAALEKKRAAQAAESKRIKALLAKVGKPHYDLEEPGDFYRRELEGLVKQAGDGLDLSRADWVIGKRMLERGYSAGQVMAAILEASPSLATRKSGHAEAYVRRTVTKLFGLIGEEG
ncbi:MAG: DNA-primase RepB domain-containing protein [Gammaproteobacteria bacterium]|nr:DNA-primase RepB domain-containing protein [Gammaproteobacteria bacterium]